MIVKKTCRNKFTALISTANRYNQASPDIILTDLWSVNANFCVGVSSRACPSLRCRFAVKLEDALVCGWEAQVVSGRGIFRLGVDAELRRGEGGGGREVGDSFREASSGGEMKLSRSWLGMEEVGELTGRERWKAKRVGRGRAVGRGHSRE